MKRGGLRVPTVLIINEAEKKGRTETSYSNGTLVVAYSFSSMQGKKGGYHEVGEILDVERKMTSYLIEYFITVWTMS